MRLAGKASVPAGGPFVFLLPPGGPAGGLSLRFGLYALSANVLSAAAVRFFASNCCCSQRQRIVIHISFDTFGADCTHTAVPQRPRRSFQCLRQAPRPAAAAAAAAAAGGVYCVCF